MAWFGAQDQETGSWHGGGPRFVQGLAQVLVAGATASTDIAIAGIVADDAETGVEGDKIVGAIGIKPSDGTAAGDVADFTANASITEDGIIQFDVVTTGYDIIVTFARANNRPA